MNIDLSKILDFLNSLYGMPKVAVVFFFCIAACAWIHALIKNLPFIPNYVIPIAVPCIVPFIGAISLLGCSQWEKSTIPTVGKFAFFNLMIGFITGTIATLVYGVAIVRFLKRFRADQPQLNVAEPKKEA